MAKILINVDSKSLGFDSNDKLVVKIAPKTDHPYQGLSFNANGEIIATKGRDGSSGSGIRNYPGNGIGPPSQASNVPLPIIGMNSTVSRHKSYTGSNTFIKENDGVIMSTISNQSVVGGLAYYIIQQS